MIELARVSRRFGPVQAVAGVSFAVGRGEVVALLGDNGAGKTTTLRLISGFLAADQGQITVAGIDVAARPLEARRQLGVLVENAPVYAEMRVRDYLGFRARLKGVSDTASVIARCELGEMADRPAGQLSRGFRQRLGLADALLGDPPVLLLDEPTSGLDPVQVSRLRTLIAELAVDHTVLLSTHALAEVEVLARRVVMLRRGQVIAEDSPAGLIARLPSRGSLVVVAAAVADQARAILGAGPGPGAIETPLGVDEISRQLVAAGIAIEEVRALRPSLEDVFVALSQEPG
jgi:ABC-2 type transport system ATP-binding protein